MSINIKASYDDFRELRENNSYYIDKTDILEEYLLRNFDKAVLFARPRRFGKTLTMTMFRDFLDVRQDSLNIFQGLKVMKNNELVDEYMNRYPVVFISLKAVFGDSFESVYQSLCIVVSKLCEENKFLVEEDNKNISEVSRQLFKKLWAQEAKQTNTEQSLDLISQMLKQYYGKPVFVIIDEYDVPMAKALGTPAYEKVRDMIEHMLSYVCKTNANVKAVMLSGCLYTVKNSSYTGVNNILPYTVLSSSFASGIGFTDLDVKKVLDDAELTDELDLVSEWYDGYIFGRVKMYCPWDVLLYVKSVLNDDYSKANGPESYWLNTSETSLNIIRGFLGKTANVNEMFEQLLAGNTIECTVKDSLPYHKIHENGDNIWSALLETGYLTKAVTEKMQRMPLRIPNKEVKVAFRQEVWEFFRDKIDNIYVRDLVDSLWNGENKKAETDLTQILEATLSFYHEYHEYSYHLILDGFFTGFGYRVQSERESGFGRSDLLILDPGRMRGMILELKHAKTESELEAAIREGILQIAKKHYESILRYEGYNTYLKYSIAFYDKNCIIERLT
ncbi:MAG: ATP-binding protein [Lachnospiraceae bacterium]|nr:ATP-binding protein [Lachnospiraceae bacterium]